MYNLKLKNRQIRKTLDIPFDDIESDDEWITEEGDNVDVEQTQVEGDGENDDLAGASLNDLTTLDGHAQDGHAPDLDNIVLMTMIMNHLEKNLMLMKKMVEMISLED